MGCSGSKSLVPKTSGSGAKIEVTIIGGQPVSPILLDEEFPQEDPKTFASKLSEERVCTGCGKGAASGFPTCCRTCVNSRGKQHGPTCKHFQEDKKAGGQRPSPGGYKLDLTTKRILLVSDNLSGFEKLIQAAKDHVMIVPVKYDTWTLKQLRDEIYKRCGHPDKSWASVGIMDHGRPGQFCLLNSIGRVSLADVKKNTDLQSFFKFIAGYVRPAKDLRAWKTDLSARIDILGCCVAAGSEGKQLLNYLEELTKVKVAAGTQKQGAGEDVKDSFQWLLDSADGLHSVHPCYFDEAKLMRWQGCACDELGAAAIGAAGVIIAAGIGYYATTEAAKIKAAEIADREETDRKSDAENRWGDAEKWARATKK